VRSGAAAKLAVTVHRHLNGHAPPPPITPVSSADTRRHLRSTNRHLFAVPRFPLNTYGRRAFSALKAEAQTSKGKTKTTAKTKA